MTAPKPLAAQTTFMSNPVRVRFAPSPTGPLHIGGVRTALYNYLLAKKLGGQFLLRIEDTDQTRFVPGAEEYILEALHWLGLDPDEGLVWSPEGPKQQGPHAPYRQSERKEMYAQYAYKLVEEGNAYYAFDTEDELNAMRERLKAARVVSPQYNAITRTTMKNSLTLPEDEVKQRLASGDPYVIRLKMPRKEEIRLQDQIRGWVMVHSSTLDDKVLLKSDGMPTYHLANVVDDHLMGITHVIRGEEWLPSAPTHVLLYRYLGWEATMPQFAHLPLLLKPDGNGKLSKRDGEMMGFPVFPLQWNENGEPKAMGFREEGYLSDALVNFLAFLGWNPGTNQELFSLEELVEAFSIERVGKSGTKFDINKAHWFNQQYLQAKSPEELAQFLGEELQAKGITADEALLLPAAALVKERCTFAKDLASEAEFLFVAPTDYEQKVVESKWNAEVSTILSAYATALASRNSISPTDAKALVEETAAAHGQKLGKVMQPLRLAISGKGAGPDLMEVISLLGPAQVAERIQAAVRTLG